VAGTVAGLAKERLVARFDTERGGDDGEGWPMGRDPREEDIAGILLDLPDLESIVSIARLEVGELGGERPWRGGVGPQELAMLAPEDILIRFEVLEAVG
jgi:hypothetical protein